MLAKCICPLCLGLRMAGSELLEELRRSNMDFRRKNLWLPCSRKHRPWRGATRPGDYRAKWKIRLLVFRPELLRNVLDTLIGAPEIQSTMCAELS